MRNLIELNLGEGRKVPIRDFDLEIANTMAESGHEGEFSTEKIAQMIMEIVVTQKDAIYQENLMKQLLGENPPAELKKWTRLIVHWLINEGVLMYTTDLRVGINGKGD